MYRDAGEIRWVEPEAFGIDAEPEFSPGIKYV